MRSPHRLLRFAAVGVVNTGVYYGCYLLLHLVLPYLVAHLAATAIAMVGSYLMNCYVTFGVRPRWRTFALFPLSNLANVVVTTAGVGLAVEGLGWGETWAPLVVALVAVPITFVVASLVMRERPQV